MAVTQIADIYNPLVVGSKAAERFLLKNALIQSGAFALDGEISNLIARGTAGELPFRQDFSSQTDNISSDDPSTDATAQKLAWTFQRVIALNRNGRWGSADLARIIGGVDPLGDLANGIGDFWAARFQDAALSCIQGIIADNIANDAGDMFLDLSVSSGTVLAANKASRDAIIEAKATAGDRRGELGVAKHLEKIDTTSFTLPSEVMPFKSYNGMVVVEDDSIPVTGTGAYKASTLYFAAAGAIAWGQSTEGLVPEEFDRAPAAGNGGGVEYFYSRRRFAFAPNGFSCLAAANPSNATLALAASWDRKVARKNAGIAALKVNLI